VPLVTVGIPFFAARASLGDAIRSVFAQTITDWELLLVDDGSTDGSLDVARRVDDPRVRVVSDGVRRRLPARLNQIVALARGDLVARLDADDMTHPSRLGRQLALLAARASLDLVASSLVNLDVRGEVTGVAADHPGRAEPFRVLRKGFVAHATVTARRSWLLANPYDERYPRAEDRELFARTCRSVRFAHLAEPLYFQCHRKDASSTVRDYVASSRDSRRVFVDHAARLAGPLATAPLVAESIAKEAVFRAFTAAGMQERLVRRRGRPPTADERDEVAAAIRRIRETRVPGLD
jgi:glycosyltransferase involved in cell wall biosynthesis